MLLAKSQEGSHALPDCWRKVFQLKLTFGIVVIPGGRNIKEKRSEVLVLINPFNLPSTTMEFHEPLGTEIGCTCGCQGCIILLNHLPPLGGTDLELFKESSKTLAFSLVGGSAHL